MCGTSCNKTKPTAKIATLKEEDTSGKTNRDVEVLKFSDIEVEYFFKDLSGIFPNFTNITIKDCGLSKRNQSSGSDRTGKSGRGCLLETETKSSTLKMEKRALASKPVWSAGDTQLSHIPRLFIGCHSSSCLSVSGKCNRIEEKE